MKLLRLTTAGSVDDGKSTLRPQPPHREPGDRGSVHDCDGGGGDDPLTTAAPRARWRFVRYHTAITAVVLWKPSMLPPKRAISP
jgi:hypothetical protein